MGPLYICLSFQGMFWECCGSLVAKDASNSLVLVSLADIAVKNKENCAWVISRANIHLDGNFGQPDRAVIIDCLKGLNQIKEWTFSGLYC